jgi:hypothetical protein
MTIYHESEVGALLGPTADLTIYGQTQGTGTLVSLGMIGANNITINGGKVDVDVSGIPLPAIWSNGDMVINNGIVYAIGEGGGIFATSMGAKSDDMTTHNITINGGQVSACGTSSELDNMGIVAKGIITLGWRNADDYIYCSRYYADSILRIAEGKAFIDYYGNIYSGIIDTVSGGHYPIGEWNALHPYVAITKSISGHNNSGGWYLIASPVAELMPADDNGFLTNEFDLYRFNPTHEGNEWENYKANSFTLVNGQGYLYASSDTTTLVFAGVPVAGHTYVVELVYDANDEHKCWNLVGNPFDGNATLDRPYYVLSADGLDINPEPIPATTPIPPCTAVFVKAVTPDDTVVFTRVTPLF